MFIEMWPLKFGSSLQHWLARRRLRPSNETHRDLVHASLLSIRSWCSRAIYSSGGIRSGRGTIGSIGVEVVNHFCVKLICSLRLGTSSIAATTCTTSSNTSSTSRCAIGRRLRGNRLWLILALSVLSQESFSNMPYGIVIDLRYAVTQSFHGNCCSFGCIENDFNLH